MKPSTILLVATSVLTSTVAIPQQSSAPAPQEWHRDDRGNGDAVLFIHGGIIAGTPEDFLSQESLRNYRLVTYNRRGYSGSPPESGPAEDYIQRHAADAAALLSQLGIDDAHVVGHSSGGLIALQFALSNPDMVRSLVLLEPAIGTAMAPSDLQQDGEDLARLMAHVQANEFIDALDLFFATQAGMPEWRSIFSPAEVRQGEAYAQTFFFFEGQGIGSWVPPEGVVSDGLPVLYVSGSESSVPKAYVDAITAWFPQTEVVEIQSVGHAFYAEDPEAVAVEIAGFLDRL
jgi:pimeloyl-ACP methyl ester carboxylesterase